MKIEEEIKQKQFVNELIKADVNIMFTASWLSRLKTDILKPYCISFQQFNILRILRGTYPEPATVKMLTKRMVDRMSNASRLVDKLCSKELVIRKACRDDMRKVDVLITEKGLKLIEQISKELEAKITEAIGLSTEEACQLNELLDKLRVKPS